MGDTVAGDGDLDEWGLEIFDDDLLSVVGGELFPGGVKLADPKRLPEGFSGPGRSSGAPST